MTYPQAIQYLFSQLPMFSRVGAAAYKKDLDNTLALCAHFDNPHLRFPSMHIAGTNGKGSTSHLLAAAFQSAGYKTALYTSPHYLDFKERIKINGEMISKTFVIEFTQKIQKLVPIIQPSFFEITVVMAFCYFAQQKVDIAIIETGLGGRLDSTNVIKPLISIITNIDYDHTDMLGDTLAKIAYEKAGIIKSKTPVLIGESHQETTEVFTEKAKNEHAPLYFAEQLIHIKLQHKNLEHAHYQLHTQHDKQSYNIALQLLGDYQIKNLSTAAAAQYLINHYTQFKITPEQFALACAHVQTSTGLLGRWQIIQKNPLIIADAAHNPHGIKYVVKQLQRCLIDYQLQKIHFIFGCVKDKDVSNILAQLPNTATYYFCNADIPRAKPAADLAIEAQNYNLSGKYYPTVAKAVAQAIKYCQYNEMIFIGGSIFVVGEALSAI